MLLWKRALSLVLVAVMCMGMLPAAIFAADDEPSTGAETGYDAESGTVTVAEVPEGTVTLILAGYKDGQMVFSLTGSADHLPAAWTVPEEITFDTLKVFFLDANSAPTADALQVWPIYTVSFLPNGSNVQNMPAAQTVAGGCTAIEPAAPERTGYAFMGWITQAEGTEKFDFSTEITRDLTLYALWAQKSGEVNTVYAFDETHIQYDSTECIQYIDNILLAFVDDGLTDAEKDDIAALVNGVVVGSLEEVSNLLQIRVATASLTELTALAEQLTEHPKVQYATFDAPMGNFSTSSNYTYADTDPWGSGITWTEDEPAGNNWAWEAIHAQSAWEAFGADRKDVTVGILDNGFSTGHTDLKNLSVINAEDNDEEESHGTNVAGVIGAENNDIGVCGVAYDADLVCYDYSAARDVIYYLDMFDQMIARGASVINISLGYDIYDQSCYRAKCKENDLPVYETYEEYLHYMDILTETSGVLMANYISNLVCSGVEVPLFVQIAGNGINNEYSIPHDAKLSGLFAACTKELTDHMETRDNLAPNTIKSHILIVASIENDYIETEAGRVYSLVSGSCRGETVDICAPGRDIYTTANDRFLGADPDKYGIHTQNKDDVYRTDFGGTSAAAPFVAGVAALVRSINPQLTTAEVRDILLNETTASGHSNSGIIPSGTYPLVDAYAAAKKAHELINTGSVFGSVKDTDGNPIPATVELYGDGITGKTVTCDEDGNYSFDRVPYGAYTVAAYHPEYHTESGLSTAYYELFLDSDLYPVPFTLIKTQIADFYVHAGSTNLLESGSFVMSNKAASAQWTVTASAEWSLTVPQNDWLTVSSTSGAAGETALTVSAGSGSAADRSVTLTFTMGENTYPIVVKQKAWSVRGTVTDGTSPVSGASVVIWNDTFRSVAVTTGGDGTFSLQVPDGSYSVTVTAEGFEETTVAVPSAVNGCDTSVTVALSADNRCGENLTWQLDENGLLTISGTGAMYDFVNSNAPWYGQRNNIKKLQVDEGVTTIGHYAFYQCNRISEVLLPSTLTSIGNGAFFLCSRIEIFPIPASLEVIGWTAFSGCSSLTAFTVDAHNTFFAVVDDVLYSRDLATLVKIPEMKRVNFSDADASYEILDGVRSVAPGAFEGLMGSIYTAPDGTVTYSGIQHLYFPASVTEIPWSEFNGTDYNYIPHLYFEGIAPVDNDGWTYNQQADAVIHFYKDQTADIVDNRWRNGWTSPLWVSPTGDIYQTVCVDAKVTASGTVTDADGTPLEGITVRLRDTNGEELPVYTVTDAAGYYTFQLGEAAACTLELQADGYGTTTVNVVLNEGSQVLDTVALTKTGLIAEGTYYYAQWKLDTNGVLTVSGRGSINHNEWSDYEEQIVDIRIESGITRVSLNPYYQSSLRSVSISDTVTSLNIYIAGYVSTFREIIVDENNPTYTAVDGILYSKDGKTLICYPCGKTDTAFSIPEGVTTLGEGAFDSCTNLRSVTLPASLTALEDGAFYGCDALSAFTVAADNQTFAAQDGVLFTKDMTTLILYPPAKSSTAYVIPDSVTTLQDGIDSDALTTVTLGASLTDLGDGFSGSRLNTIIVSRGNTAYTVQDGVLFSKDMTTLVCYPRAKAGDSYTVPASVTTLAANALYYTPLKTIILPAGLDTVVAWALASSKLENVYFNGPVPSAWEKYACGSSTSRLTLYYIEGAAGWTSPTWTDPHGTIFNTKTFAP